LQRLVVDYDVHTTVHGATTKTAWQTENSTSAGLDQIIRHEMHMLELTCPETPAASLGPMV
jgi:hypothetical protein